MSSTEPTNPEATLTPSAGQAWAAFSTSDEATRTWLGQLGVARPRFDLASRPQPGGAVALYSFESQQLLYERELYEDETDLQDRFDAGTTGLELLLESGVSAQEARAAAERAGIGALVERGYRLLSTGETRLFLLLREVLAKPELLIVQEPFEGLDARWRASAEQLLGQVVAEGRCWVALSSRSTDAPAASTHWALLREDAQPLVLPCTDPTQVPPELQQLLQLKQAPLSELPPAPVAPRPLPEPLVRMRNSAVRYHLPNGELVTQFEGLDWELRQGEHTLVTGPNGAGKSTLLQLLSGDHPQCYGNDLWLFGYVRGSGESVWDIKRHVGVVSPALHRDYRARCDTLSVVVSGLYDSIGVYRDVPEPDRRLARRWLEVMGLVHTADAGFQGLTWAQQRLVLIARGLIKHPPLLILDEPTQGLDEMGRQLVLTSIARLAHLEHTTLLFVTHRPDERLPLFRRHLEFIPSAREGVRFEVRIRQV